jgi:hypothetical protein
MLDVPKEGKTCDLCQDFFDHGGQRGHLIFEIDSDDFLAKLIFERPRIC